MAFATGTAAVHARTFAMAVAVHGHGHIECFLLRRIQAGVEGLGGVFTLLDGGVAFLAQALGLVNALGRGQLAEGLTVHARRFALCRAGGFHVLFPGTFLGGGQLQQGLDAFHVLGMHGGRVQGRAARLVGVGRGVWAVGAAGAAVFCAHTGRVKAPASAAAVAVAIRERCKRAMVMSFPSG
jgi:hypothetical protein